MRSREITSGLCVVAALVLVGATEFGRAQQATPAAAGQAGGRGAAPAPRPPLLDKDHLRFQPEDAATGGPVFGRESEPGVYITRNLFRKGPGGGVIGGGSRPHYHDQDRWVVVIQGTWYTAVGDLFEPDKMVAIKQGGMMYHPAGLHHYDGAKDEDAIVQITGVGPVKTVQSEVDANGQPVTRGGGAGRAAGAGAPPTGR
jgi:mannose-6-phosphate isomerase-like protein (cupin superfamily)